MMIPLFELIGEIFDILRMCSADTFVCIIGKTLFEPIKWDCTFITDIDVSTGFSIV